MLEYGIKSITTNPTLITKSTEIIRLVDTRSHKTRAFVLPASYESVVEEMFKEMEFKKWVEDRKRKLKANSTKDNLNDVMFAGIESVHTYIGDEK